MANGKEDNIALNLYKMEYEKCAERFDNIYKSIWQIFAYLAAVAGGIITFSTKGGENTYLIVAVASSLLVVWWLAIFEPMNRYGYQTASRLANLEEILNKLYEEQLKIVSEVAKDDTVKEESFGLKHFTEFKTIEKKPYEYRVIQSIRVFGSMLLGVAIGFFIYGIWTRLPGDFWTNGIRLISIIGGIVVAVISIIISLWEVRKKTKSNKETNKRFKRYEELNSLLLNIDVIKQGNKEIHSLLQEVKSNKKLISIDEKVGLMGQALEDVKVLLRKSEIDKNMDMINEKISIISHESKEIKLSLQVILIEMAQDQNKKEES